MTRKQGASYEHPLSSRIKEPRPRRCLLPQHLPRQVLQPCTLNLFYCGLPDLLFEHRRAISPSGQNPYQSISKYLKQKLEGRSQPSTSRNYRAETFQSLLGGCQSCLNDPREVIIPRLLRLLTCSPSFGISHYSVPHNLASSWPCIPPPGHRI
jgi:hypothetical protein